MSTAALLQQLQNCQSEAVALCRAAGESYNRQEHSDISPVGWHLGHCIFTESYWIHEVFLQDSACDTSMHELYNPLHTHKPGRGPALPAIASLCTWAEQTQADNRQTLCRANGHRDDLDLMQNHFLLHFLIQHYAQHLETMQTAFAQSARKLNGINSRITPLRARPVPVATVTLPAGEYAVGAEQAHRPYDNEYPAHKRTLSTCHIMTVPVSNAAYLHFMQENGYKEKAYWSDDGWRWQQENQVKHPAYWYRDDSGQWSVIDHRGHQSLQPHAPVHGLSYHEASAYANWAGGRLPHEHEWEAAFKTGLLQACGFVWEWCCNSFYPYAGFCAYPYDGYSVPYFDGTHFTLKGGSILTRGMIKRAEFRNYYQADKNFLYAGIRLVFE